MKKRIIPVVIGVIRKRDKYLLTKRVHKDKQYHAKWQFPGGEVEFAESLIASLKRELLEELGIKLQSAQFLGQVFETVGSSDSHILLLPFLCSIDGSYSKITLLDVEASELGWFTLPEILKLNCLKHTHSIAKKA